MSIHNMLMSAAGGVSPPRVVDVFSAYTYTGVGAGQTITNGIDLAGKGGLIWTKVRSNAFDSSLTDTARGITYRLSSSTSGASVNVSNTPTSVTSTGYVLPIDNAGHQNYGGFTYVSHTFRKAPKFFDMVTYTGDGVAGRQIPHALGVAPGIVIVKNLTTALNWAVYHRSLGNQSYLYLNATTGAMADVNIWGATDPAASAITLGNYSVENALGDSYIAYLFAHDTSANGVVQCGSFTTDGSGNATVNHGWTAGVQFAQIKASSTTGDWEVYDTARTAAWSGADARLRANLSSIEDSVSRLSASGTSVSFSGLSVSATYVYLFIVAPT